MGLDDQELTIAIIAGELDPDDLGGAEVHIVEVARRLAQRGHKIHLFVGSDDGIARILKEDTLQVHRIDYDPPRNMASLLYIKHAIRALDSFLKKNRVDILHAKQVFPFGVVTGRLRGQHNIPVYVTAQNPYAYYEELVLQMPGVGRMAGGVLQRILMPFARFALRNADVVAAVSDYSRNGCVRLGADNTIIVPNGVDTAVFPYSKSREREDGRPLRLVSTSTLIPRNGLETLVQATALLKKGGTPVKVILAGEGPLKDELRSLALKLGIGEDVDFIGTIRHEKVPDLLADSDIFVRPSIAEGFGVSFIEAMAVGIPVVTCPSGGIVDFVSHRKTGMLVPSRQPEALAEAIVELANDSSLYNTIVRNALSLVESTYNWEVITDSVEAAYHSLIEPRKNCMEGV